MAGPTYPGPEDPAYRIRGIRQIQDEDFVSATEVVNPVVEGILESVDYLRLHTPALGEDGKVPETALPLTGGLVAQDTPPENTKLGWIDTGNGSILKYFDGAAWQAVSSVWG